MLKIRHTKTRIKQTVYAAKHATGNHRYGLDKLPKKHWMRTDAAKEARKSRNRIKYGGGMPRGVNL